MSSSLPFRSTCNARCSAICERVSGRSANTGQRAHPSAAVVLCSLRVCAQLLCARRLHLRRLCRLQRPQQERILWRRVSPPPSDDAAQRTHRLVRSPPTVTATPTLRLRVRREQACEKPQRQRIHACGFSASAPRAKARRAPSALAQRCIESQTVRANQTRIPHK
jgi:hypothetical protein